MDSVSEDAFREALARFASGVVVVTAHAEGGPVGFTVSAFSALSLDPPLVLVCVAKTASAYDATVAASSFGVSVLEASQGWVALQFARQGVDRFHGIALRPGTRLPLLEGAIAQLECERHALHDAGDHTIVVGRVVEARHVPGEPLVHYARSFGELAQRSR